MKVLVLHSGGLDSTVCLLQAREQGHDILSLGIDYGQRHRVELLYAEQQCRRFQVPRNIIRVEWQKPAREVPLDRSIDEIRVGISAGFLPGRNAVFLSLASAHAAGVGASEVWVGVNAVDYSGYPDCRPEFISSFATMLAYAIPQGPRVCAPLLKMTKPEIAHLAATLGLARGDTWSCYRPQLSHLGVCPCGSCDACKLHDYAWQE